jgi:RNA polymerase sigma factor (sigma-70 family)
MPELDDHKLLAEFARNESGTAFASLVARYVNLVYSTARRFAGDPHHAEEITQAVFIILARKAGKLSPRTVLSGWLYQTARLTAANFVKGEIRRQHREQEAYMQSTLTEPDWSRRSEAEADAAWPQLAPHLDEAMGRLGETDRNAIVLRFFENKTAREVGAALKLTEAAAHKRVNRALEKLRKIFSKRGVTLSGAIIAGAVSANSVQAAPAGLAATISTTAVKGSAVAATVSSLVKGTLKIMAYTKLKLAVGIAAGILLAGGAVTVAISQINSEDKWTPQEIAKHAQDTYAVLSSYSDDGKVIEEVGGQTITTTFNIRLQRPNLYRIEWSQAMTPSITNGGVVWSAGDGDFTMMNRNGQPIIKQRKNKDMQTTLASATGLSGQASAMIPEAFFKQYWGNALNPASVMLQRQADEKVNGVDCYVLSSSTGPKTGQGVVAVQNTMTTFWIGKLDHLIHQTRTGVEAASIRLPQFSDADLKEMLQEQNKPVTPEAITALRKQLEATTKQAQAVLKSGGQSGKMVATQTHENIVVNQKFSPADFAP